MGNSMYDKAVYEKYHQRLTMEEFFEVCKELELAVLYVQIMYERETERKISQSLYEDVEKFKELPEVAELVKNNAGKISGIEEGKFGFRGEEDGVIYTWVFEVSGRSVICRHIQMEQ